MNTLSRAAALSAAIMLPTLSIAQEQGTPQSAPAQAAPQNQYQPRSQQAPYPGAPQNAYPQSASPPPTSENMGQTYVGARLGVVIPKHDDMKDFDNGFAIEGAVGYRINENAAVEFSIGRFSLGYSTTAVISGVVANVTEDVVAYPVQGTLKLMLPLDKLDLYALAGGGIYFIHDEGKATASGYLPLTASDSDSPFGFHLGGGINIRVSPRALIGAEVKYMMGTVTLYDTKSHFDSIMIGGGLTFQL